jgi:hypothetical protein
LSVPAAGDADVALAAATHQLGDLIAQCLRRYRAERREWKRAERVAWHVLLTEVPLQAPPV